MLEISISKGIVIWLRKEQPRQNDSTKRKEDVEKQYGNVSVQLVVRVMCLFQQCYRCIVCSNNTIDVSREVKYSSMNFPTDISVPLETKSHSLLVERSLCMPAPVESRSYAHLCPLGPGADTLLWRWNDIGEEGDESFAGVLERCWRSAHCPALALSHLNLVVDDIHTTRTQTQTHTQRSSTQQRRARACDICDDSVV
jgi:hypothetical protein